MSDHDAEHASALESIMAAIDHLSDDDIFDLMRTPPRMTIEQWKTYLLTKMTLAAYRVAEDRKARES